MYLSKIRKEIDDFVKQNVKDTPNKGDPIEMGEKSAIRKKLSVKERGPVIENYKSTHTLPDSSSRPSLPQLHMSNIANENINDEIKNSPKRVSFGKNDNKKFGWIQGVLVRCILNILGAILFLRLSWVAGNAGILLGSGIVLLASLVTVITALSMCAICTNGEIRGGGVYYMISRSLGPEFGGSIGLIFTIANNVAAAMYIVAFGETVRDLLLDYNLKIVDGGDNDIRIISWITAFVILAIVILGVSFEAKAQLILLVILTISYANFLVGTFLEPNFAKREHGITGYSKQTIQDNLWPTWWKRENFVDEFFKIFKVYFPAATGIMAGANVSSDLKNPEKSIPKGTLWAILITTLVYLLAVVSLGSICVREFSQSSEDLLNTTIDISFENQTTHGLIHDQTMKLASAFSPLVIAGTFAATLSSALASLVSAPKILQAVGNDKLYPYLKYFAKGYGENNEPRRGYLLAFVICMAVIGIGELNVIAFIISNFFLASYALVNYACFDASFSESLGFRPSFKYFNKWVSLFGAIICVAIMFLISWGAALGTFALVMILFVYLYKRKPDVNWGSTNQAYLYKNALQNLQKLQTIEEHVKNYRPQILLLSGTPIERASLIDFVSNVTKRNSLLILGDIITGSVEEIQTHNVIGLSKFITQWLKKRSIKAFYQPIIGTNFEEGLTSLLQTAGIGKLRPNILFVGYKTNWRTCNTSQLADYFRTIHHGFDFQLGVAIFRYSETFDFSLPNCPLGINNETFENDLESYVSEEYSEDNNHDNDSNFDDIEQHENLHIKRRVNSLEMHANDNETSKNVNESAKFQINSLPSIKIPDLLTMDNVSMRCELNKISLPPLRVFYKRIKKATIDVWWLYDDGGLTLLLPYLLSLPKSYLEDATLRIFSVANSRTELESEKANFSALLRKFRIDYKSCYVIPDLLSDPSRQLIEEFKDLMEPFVKHEDQIFDHDIFITTRELNIHREKTYRHLRIRELLMEYSKQATLIVMTLPVPRKSCIPASLYLAWLEMLSKDLCPVLFVRGNQQSVLTFYS